MRTTQNTEYNNHQIATAFDDAGSRDIVIFCHGYRGSSIGPSRFFVKAAKLLEEKGISSLRFDQYGCGNSDGDFYDSSFNDWISTTKVIAQDYINRGYRVALFGQSMGGSTVIVVGSGMKDIVCVVAWVPDASVDAPEAPPKDYMEEGGQRVQASFWQEAHDADIVNSLKNLSSPACIIQCTADEYVDEINRQSISANAQPQHKVVTYEDYPHSAWTYDQAEDIIRKSVSFIAEQFHKA